MSPWRNFLRLCSSSGRVTVKRSSSTSSSSSSLSVPSPSWLGTPTSEVVGTEQLRTGPGPSNVIPRVLQAQALPILGELDEEFLQIMDDVKEGLQYAFQTRNPLTLAASGAGHAAMEATMSNLVEPGDVVLVATSGLWGERFAEMGRRQGGDVRLLSNPFGIPFSSEQFASALESERPSLLCVTHGESTSGCVQELEGLAELCRR